VILFTPIKYPGLFFVYASFIIACLFLSKVPLKFIIKRLLEILPFIAIIAVSSLFVKNGRIIFSNCIIKASLSVLVLLIMSSTTSFTQLIRALSELEVPRLFLSLLSFMYRYLFLLEDQLLRTRRAFDSRNINKNNFKSTAALGNLLGVIFIRTYERAERVYMAMCARGYDGNKNN
jgi:cobalt/nickel transport system permease protein